MTPVSGWPGHLVRQVVLDDVGGLVCTWHIPEPGNQRVRQSFPDGISAGQVLLNANSLSGGDEGTQFAVLAAAVQTYESGSIGSFKVILGDVVVN